MEKELDKFYDNITIKSKVISIYEDENGNYNIINTAGLFVAVEYLQVNKEEKTMATFQQILPKNIIGKKTRRVRPIPKNEITHKDEDKYTLVEQEEEVEEFYVVSNALKVSKVYTDKDEALKVAKKINKKIMEALGE
jgi:hypothetical protein